MPQAKQPKILKNYKRTQRTARPDSKKEGVLKQLVGICAKKGWVVRREQLKRGHGWKVVSGTCRKAEERLIFVDRRLSQDDQIAFLVGKLREDQEAICPDALQELPERYREALVAESA